MLFYIYCITNLFNNKIYIGVSNDPDNRWKTHKNIARGGKEKFPNHFQIIHKAIVKYGENNFSFEIIKVFSNEDEAYFSEEDIISDLKKLEVPNYNIAGGGKGTGSGINHPMFGKKLPPDWVAALSESSKEINNRPEVKEIRKQQMIARNWIGENHPMFGKMHSEETKIEISKKGKGRKFSKTHKSKISKSNANKPKSEEHRKNISLSKIGKNSGTNNPNAKLSREDTIEIIKLLTEGLSSRKIAKRFDVSKTTILRIKNDNKG
jgi:group I intron endonuclease